MRMASTEPLRVTGPANCSRDANTAVITLLQSWTEIDSSSPSYTCDQLAAWIRALGAREFDEEISENAEAWAKVLFFEQKLKCGFQWTRLPPFFFRDTMKFPAVYAKVFEDAIPALARDEMKSAVRTPVVNCDPGTQPHADDLSSSSLDSFALRDILAQNAASNEKLQEAMYV